MGNKQSRGNRRKLEISDITRDELLSEASIPQVLDSDLQDATYKELEYRREIGDATKFANRLLVKCLDTKVNSNLNLSSNFLMHEKDPVSKAKIKRFAAFADIKKDSQSEKIIGYLRGIEFDLGVESEFSPIPINEAKRVPAGLYESQPYESPMTRYAAEKDNSHNSTISFKEDSPFFNGNLDKADISDPSLGGEERNHYFSFNGKNKYLFKLDTKLDQSKDGSSVSSHSDNSKRNILPANNGHIISFQKQPRTIEEQAKLADCWDPILEESEQIEYSTNRKNKENGRIISENEEFEEEHLHIQDIDRFPQYNPKSLNKNEIYQARDSNRNSNQGSRTARIEDKPQIYKNSMDMIPIYQKLLRRKPSLDHIITSQANNSRDSRMKSSKDSAMSLPRAMIDPQPHPEAHTPRTVKVDIGNFRKSNIEGTTRPLGLESQNKPFKRNRAPKYGLFNVPRISENQPIVNTQRSARKNSKTSSYSDKENKQPVFKFGRAPTSPKPVPQKSNADGKKGSYLMNYKSKTGHNGVPQKPSKIDRSMNPNFHSISNLDRTKILKMNDKLSKIGPPKRAQKHQKQKFNLEQLMLDSAQNDFEESCLKESKETKESIPKLTSHACNIKIDINQFTKKMMNSFPSKR